VKTILGQTVQRLRTLENFLEIIDREINVVGCWLRLFSPFRDVNQRKTSEEERLKTSKLESLGTLAAGIAHDLNNILAPIMMAVQMLRWGLKPEELEKMISTVETSAQRGAELVKQLLTFGRGVEGKHVLIQAEHLVRDMVKIAQQTFPKVISVKSKLPAGLWPVLVDSTQLHQVLLNLCVNARDAMPNGGRLTIRTANVGRSRAPSYLTPGDYVLISVANLGAKVAVEQIIGRVIRIAVSLDRDVRVVFPTAVDKAHRLSALEVSKDSFCCLEVCIRRVRVELRELLDCVCQIGARAEHCIHEGSDD
jgi:signal transduction histidine kinase